ncbi:MAG: penicillin-binding protein 2, partial [Sphingomonadaceae bacterium]|nr:penicillin-binding protein 2 [Sphingomonadaceae bacterium]
VGLFLFGALIAVVLLRLLMLAVLEDRSGRGNGDAFAGLLPPRADIVDRNGVVLARTIDGWTIAVHPNRLLNDPDELAPRLAALLPERSAGQYRAILASGRRFVYLRHQALPELVSQVNALGEPAIEFLREPERLYPQVNLAPHALGWVNRSGRGSSGLEFALDARLSDPARRGEPVALSIDSRVQGALQTELADAMRRQSAMGAVGIVLDVHTGELIALASLPNFDPNAPTRTSEAARRDRARVDVYELGSTFKPITVAGAIEEGVVASLDRRYNAEAPLQVGGFTIRDDHAQRRYLNVPELLVHSSNIATARIADEMGPERMQRLFRRLHFDEPVAFEMAGNSAPLWPDYWARTTVMTTGFGHGIAVTPLHLASAYATLVNGGLYRPMTILKRASGDIPPGERVFSRRTSDHMRALLRLIVLEGTGRNADAEGFRVGGKTGTAEIPGAGGYRENDLVSTFASAFPMDDPQYVVVVMMDRPRGDAATGGGRTAGWTAAPVVRSVVARIGPLLGVMPSEDRDVDTEYLREMLWHPRSER